eukprot:103249_1
MDMFEKFAEAILDGEGAQAASILRMAQLSPGERNKMLHNVSSNNRQFRALLERNIEAPFDSIMFSHFVSASLSAQNKHNSAWESQHEAIDVFLTWMKEDDQKKCNWYLPILDALLSQFRITAHDADTHGQKKSSSHFQTKSDVEIKKVFSAMAQNRFKSPQSPKLGAVLVVNHLFKIYFRLNKLHLCSSLRKTIEGNNFPPLDRFPKAHTVTYYYYSGQLDLFAGHYQQANKSLTRALELCHPNYHGNKRRILYYLIPVRLYIGEYPDASLLKKYELVELVNLIDSIRRGSVSGFESEMEKHQDFYYELGIFIIIELTKCYVYRNFCKRVLTCWKKFVAEDTSGTKKPCQVPLKTFRTALEIQGIQMDEDEFECIVANLIADRMINGYIAHGRCVVFSQKAPFSDLRNATKGH